MGKQSNAERESGGQEQATRYARSLIEASLDPLVAISSEGKITDVNEATTKITGVGREHLIGTDFSDYFTEPDQARAGYRQVLAEGSVANYPLTIAALDGTLTDVLYNASVYQDTQGNVLGVIATTRDRTELEKEFLARDSAKQRQMERNFRNVTETHLEAFLLVNEIGIIVYANKAAETLFAFARGKMLGSAVEQLMPHRFRAHHPGLRDNYFSNPEVRPMGEGQELYGRRDDGTEFPVEISLIPIQTPTGPQVAVSIRDITEQKESIRRLIQANELRNEFVAVIAHDLRAPAASISGFAHLLIDEWNTLDDVKKIEYLRIVTRNTDALAGFIENVLQVARIEAGEFSYQISSFNIRVLAQRTLDEAQRPNNGRRLELITPDDLPLALGDEERQWQILTNLLSNALKFSPAKEPIVVELSRIGDWVQVAVIDRGRGIAEDDLAKLFRKSERLLTSGNPITPGNGLGLFICKTLVEAQGGRIWCESTPGQGSTFFFTIPVAR